MQARAQRSVLVLVMTALLASAPGLRAEDPVVSPRVCRFLDRWVVKILQRTMRALVDDAKLAGMTTLVARHGKVAYLYGYLDEASTCATGRILSLSLLKERLMGTLEVTPVL